ncbi:MAG TPA: hypothetical protein V6C89_12785 [Drouetiella sp.]|jgi:hypothetical protein
MSAYETRNYSPKPASVEGDHLSHVKLASENSSLHSEAIRHLSGPNAKQSGAADSHISAADKRPGATDKHASDSGKFMPTNGDYWVVRGDNLYKIAQRSLLAHGNEHPDGRSIFKEIDRIVELNLKYYPKLKDHRLEPGMILTVEEKAQPGTSGTPAKPATEAITNSKDRNNSGVCTDQTWKFAEPGTVTTAQKCDLVFAGADSKVVVHPGGQAILQKGSSGFVFKGARATVMEGATVIDAGGAIEIQPGAKIISVDALSKQAQAQAEREAQAQAEREAQVQANRQAQVQAGKTLQQNSTPQG